MYTNPINIIRTLCGLLERNTARINGVVREWQPDRNLAFFEGIRQSLPQGSYPSFEVEAGPASNQWATTRAQRPRYTFQCMLTTVTTNEKLHLEYITTLATALVEIMTSPENLQLAVVNESRWTQEFGLLPTIILDSLVEDVSYSSARDGSVRVAEFTWFAEIHEPYPDAKFQIGQPDVPTIVRPLPA